MSKAWSVNRPDNSVTQLNSTLRQKESDLEAEPIARPGHGTSTAVRLSPVQKEFWDNFQSRRDRKTISQGTFAHGAANDLERSSSASDKKQVFGFPKIVEK